MSDRKVFRVNYYVSGMPKTSFVAAATDQEASYFLGVRDGSAAVSVLASSVEVVGLDKSHEPLTPPEVFKAPPAEPRQFNNEELGKLRQILAEKK